MAILEQEILIMLNSKNIKYFEDMAYEIPRVKGKWGKTVVPRGTKISVIVSNLPEGSNVEVTKVCDNCSKHIPNQTYYSILKLRKDGDGKDRCFQCARIQSWNTRNNNIPYENSLDYWAKENNKEYLLKEFSVKNKQNPSEISFGTSEEYLWNCMKCKSEYTMKMNDRRHGNNCPFCANRRVNHTNCLWTTHPEVAKLLKNTQRGYEITSGMNKKEEFICPRCNNKDTKAIDSVVKGFSCSKCSDGISYPEKFMMNVLNQIDVDYETQKVFFWSKKVNHDNSKSSGTKKYDFYIGSLNMVIETHGNQHYVGGFERMGDRGKSLKEEQENDEYKIELAKSNAISNYIIIDCRKSNMIHIKNSIIESELSKLFDLSDIDWNKCHEYACDSIVRTACDLWNQGIKSSTEIGKIINLGRIAVRKYLKQGSELGWCDYDPKIARNISAVKNGKNGTRQIIQLAKNGEYIKTWNSITEAGNELGINISQISTVCRGRYKSAGNFKWIYKEDYKNMINN